MNPRTNPIRGARQRTVVLSRSTNHRALIIALVAVALMAMLASGCRGPKGPGHLKGPGIHIH